MKKKLPTTKVKSLAICFNLDEAMDKKIKKIMKKYKLRFKSEAIRLCVESFK